MSANAPITLTVSGDRNAGQTSDTVVELTLVPRVLGEGEDFLIAVSPGSLDLTAEAPSNVVSFFPPPVIGESRLFYIDLQGNDGQEQGEIIVQLIPAGATAIETTEIEVTGAVWATP